MKQKNLSELLRTLQKLTAVHLAEFISWDAKEIIILSLIKYQHVWSTGYTSGNIKEYKGNIFFSPITPG